MIASIITGVLLIVLLSIHVWHDNKSKKEKKDNNVNDVHY